MSRTVVIIPTYNERESLVSAVDQVRSHAPDVDIVIVDDNSPDGTGALAHSIAERDVQVSVLHRHRKEGLGKAYVHGFRHCLQATYDLLVEMDADGSHRAADLPRLIARAGAADRPDLIIGSRWMTGGAVENWSKSRQVLSRTANSYTRIMLGLPVSDSTAGFRVYRADLLRRLDLSTVESAGYNFQVDMTWRTYRAGGRIAEVPIVFEERTEGESKMSSNIVLEALRLTTKWGITHRGRQLTTVLGRVITRS